MNYDDFLTKWNGRQVKIDESDFKKLHANNKLLGLYIDKKGQQQYLRNRQGEYLHRLIMEPPKGKVVDHINRDGLDNRRSNLRIVTIQQNLRNQKRANNKTGHTGVAVFAGSRFTAQIKHNYKKIHLGVFNTVEEALKARQKAEKELWI